MGELDLTVVRPTFSMLGPSSLIAASNNVFSEASIVPIGKIFSIPEG